jgi:hypothetical protein
MGGGLVTETESQSGRSSWRVVSAVERGQRHVKTGQPCQDVLRWRLWPGETLLAAVADGAGSARFAEVGAEVAVDAAIESLAESMPEEPAKLSPHAIKTLLSHTLLGARGALIAEAGRRAETARDFATTLLVLVATPVWAAAAQIGDGAIVVGDGRDSCRTLSGPPVSEYLNETVFLSSEKAGEQAQISFWPGSVRQAALMSDGLQMLALKMPGAEPHLPFFKSLFGWLEGAEDLGPAQTQLEAFLRSPRVLERTDDDLSLLVAARVG